MGVENECECGNADESLPPPTEKPRYKSKFQPEWEKVFPGINVHRQDQHRAYCSYCHTSFSIAREGRYDVVKHVGTLMHIRAYDDSLKSAQ